MALPATDAFTGSPATNLTTYSANWTALIGNFKIGSNGTGATSASSGGDALLIWNADTFGNDQYCEWDVIALESNTWAGGALRTSATDGGEGYCFYTDSTVAQLGKFVDGVWQQIGTDQSPPTVGQRVRFEVEGTTLRVYYDASLLMNPTDSTYASGAAGLAGYNNGGASVIDNWEAGNLSGGGGPTFTDRGSMRGVMRGAFRGM